MSLIIRAASCSSVPLDADAQAIVSSFAVAPSAKTKQAINSFVVGAKHYGIFALLDLCYGFAAELQQQSLINWASPGTNDASAVNSPTFTARSNWTGNGTTSYLSSGVAFASLSRATINDMTALVWSLTNSQSNGRDFGSDATTGLSSNDYIICRSAGGVCQTRSSAATADSVSVSSSLGLFGFSRSSSAGYSQYLNGGLIGSPATVSSALANGNVSFLRGSTVFSTRALAFAVVGRALTAAQHAQLYTLVRQYLIAIGAIAPLTFSVQNLEGQSIEYMQRADLSPNTILRRTNRSIEYIGANGNSTSVGSQGTNGGAIITSTPPPVLQYRGVQFNQTGAPGTSSNEDGTRGVGTSVLIGATLVDIWPARERVFAGTQLGETHVSGLLAQLCYMDDLEGYQSTLYHGRTHGAAGQTLANVSKGTQPYANGLIEIGRAAAVELASYASPTRCYWITVRDGHQDRTGGTSRATFLAELNQLVSDYNTDWLPITGQTDPITLAIIQLDVGCQNSALSGSIVQLAQLDFARQNAHGCMSHSRYMLPHDVDSGGQGDLDHFAPASYITDGEYEAKAYRWQRAYRLGRATYPWAALGTWLTAKVTGNVLSIQFFHDQAKTIPWGGLQWNTTFQSIGLAPNYGFGWSDDSGAMISAVAITSTTIPNDTVQVSLSGTPTTNQLWSYAYNGPGSVTHSAAWGNLTDNDTTPSRYNAGQTLPNWCVSTSEAPT